MLEFRKFTVNDWKEFNELTNEAFAREGIVKEGYLNTIDDGGFIGAFADNKLIGYLRLFIHGDYGHLGQIAVEKLERGKGHGNKLMEHALSYFHSKKIGEVGLYVETKNHIAISLYEKYGFEKQFESWHYWINEEEYKQIEEKNIGTESSELRVLTAEDINTIISTFPNINREELSSHLNDEQKVGLTGVSSIPLGLFVNGELKIYGRLNPEFPGCRPFLVSDTVYFDEFIIKMKEYNKKNYIRLTFDRDNSLSMFLTERGYKLWHHLWFMKRKG